MKFTLSNGLFGLLIGSLVFFFSCEKSPKCWGEKETNLGLIIDDTTLCSNCNILTNLEEGFVVNSDLDFARIYYRNFGDEITCNPNEFNFENQSLIGISMEVSCKYKIERNVTKVDTDQTYYYDICVTECGNCLEKEYLSNWVLIPKIEDGYKVIFRTSIN